MEPTRIEKLKEEKEAIRNAVQERMTGAIIGAFGLIAGLAWNDAVKTLIDSIYPPGQGGIWPKFLYAIIVTIVVSILVYLVSKWLLPKKTEVK